MYAMGRFFRLWVHQTVINPQQQPRIIASSSNFIEMEKSVSIFQPEDSAKVGHIKDFTTAVIVTLVAILTLLCLLRRIKGSSEQVLVLKVQNKSQIPEMRGSRGDVATPACDLNAMSKSLSISGPSPPALPVCC